MKLRAPATTRVCSHALHEALPIRRPIRSARALTDARGARALPSAPTPIRNATASSPKAHPTCSTTPAAKSPAGASLASTRRRNSPAKVSNAPGRRSSRWMKTREGKLMPYSPNEIESTRDHPCLLPRPTRSSSDPTPDSVSEGANRCTRGACAPLCANTDPQRDSIFTKGPSDVLDHASSEIASGSKLGFDATKKFPGEGFKRPWPPLIKMDENARRKIDALFAK